MAVVLSGCSFPGRDWGACGTGSYWQKRFERLEAEVKRLSTQDTRLGLDDEVRRLDEKVEFLENLLAERADSGALPPGDKGESRRAPRKP